MSAPHPFNGNGNGNGPHPPNLGNGKGGGEYPGFPTVWKLLLGVGVAVVTFVGLGVFFALVSPILYAIAAAAGLALALELCGFFTLSKKHWPRWRGKRKVSHQVAHVIRCVEAAFVTASPLMHILPPVWMCFIDAAVFVHFRLSHKDLVASRLFLTFPRLPRGQKGKPHPADYHRVHIRKLSILDLRRLGVGIVAALATAICIGGPIAIALEMGRRISPDTHEPKNQQEKTPQELEAKEAQKKSENPAKPKPKEPEANPGASPRQTWNGQCPHKEGDGAPGWAYAVIFDLFAGIGSAGPGFLGCTGAMHVFRGKRCRKYLWVLGENPINHEPLSLATACKKLAYEKFVTATIYKAPASGFVRRLIETEHDHEVYGPAEIKADEGALFLLECEMGTYALVRSEPGGASVKPYIELPPPVVQAWVGAMNERPEWLWPTEEKTLANGEIIYVLAENGHPDHPLPEFTITYRKEEIEGKVEYVAHRGTYKYRTSERPEANTKELEQAAINAES